MKRPKEWQRFNVSEEEQVKTAIAIVDDMVSKLQQNGIGSSHYLVAIDYPQRIVDQVQAHYKDDKRNIRVQRSFKRTGGFR
jgi:hypothetical protein